MGIPAILVTGEAKEVETADDIAQTGAAVSLGLYDSDSGQHLREVLEDLLANQCRRLGMRNAALNNLDGRMGERLVHMIVKCLSECSSR